MLLLFVHKSLFFTHFKHVSNIRLPTSCCTVFIVSRNCFVTACPLNDSTLKLFVFVGNIKNATTVTSGKSDCKTKQKMCSLYKNQKMKLNTTRTYLQHMIKSSQRLNKNIRTFITKFISSSNK